MWVYQVESTSNKRSASSCQDPSGYSLVHYLETLYVFVSQITDYGEW